jgi:hypothetical protein
MPNRFIEDRIQCGSAWSAALRIMIEAVMKAIQVQQPGGQRRLSWSTFSGVAMSSMDMETTSVPLVTRNQESDKKGGPSRFGAPAVQNDVCRQL